MCGLAGMFGSGFIENDLKAMKTLLAISSLRGTDSTGLYIADSSKGVMKKEICSPLTFANYYGGYSSSFMNQRGMNLWLGHARDATVGDKKVENAHPFDTGRYVSAHNGTLNDHEYWYGKGTDSEQLFRRMEKEGIKGPLEELSAYSHYAVTIYDKIGKTLTFARGSSRPLHVGIVKNRPIIFWASEDCFLDMVAARHKIDMEVYYFQPYRTYTTSLDLIKPGFASPWVVEEYKRPKAVETKIQRGFSVWDNFNETDSESVPEPVVQASMVG